MNELSFRIAGTDVDAELSKDLQDLAAELQREIDGTVQAESMASGAKDGGLTLAISVGMLILTGVSGFVEVLNFWLSSRPKYTAKITLDGVELTIESHNPADLEAKLKKVQKEQGLKEFTISLARK